MNVNNRGINVLTPRKIEYGTMDSRKNLPIFNITPNTETELESGVDYDSSAVASGIGYYGSETDPVFSPNELEGSICSYEDLPPEQREERAILQATVFIEDAIEHRSIHHKVDTRTLKKYRLYHSKLIRWLLRITISVLLALAFIETPSSLTVSSHPHDTRNRPNLPCGVTESIELVCLAVLTIDFLFKVQMLGYKQAKRTKWLVATFVVLCIYYLDWLVSIGYFCNERYRVRRLLRAFFLIQNSSLMKKSLQSILQSSPQILSVLFLMGLHVYFFTMLGLVFFSSVFNTKHASPIQPNDLKQKTNIEPQEGRTFFKDTGTAVMTLVVLLTTANNPDVMMLAYSENRLYALFFILFLAIGMYFFLNVLLAAMYNQFKGSFTKSLQSSFFRRRVGIRAAFEILGEASFDANSINAPRKSVSVEYAKKVLGNIRFSKKSRYVPYLNEVLEKLPTTCLNAKQFQELFDIVFLDSVKKRRPCREFKRRILRQIQAVLLHKYFQYFGDFMSLLNVVIVTIELEHRNGQAFSTGHSMLSIFNFCFILYYAVEQSMMIFFIGPKRYFSHKNVWFESAVTWLLVLVELLCIGLYGGPFPVLTDKEIMERSIKFGVFSLSNMLRFTNMMVIVRLLRIIPSIKPLFMVASTLVDLVKNMRAFGGIVIFIYYIFGIMGMMVFEGKSPVPPPSQNSSSAVENFTCGSYEQLGYYANNFNDFASSLVVLWDVMVVNNWFVFLEAYNRTTNSRFTQIYFIVWWLAAAVVCINLFIALVIEAFITQYERSERLLHTQKKHKKRKYAHNEETSRHFRVHEMFRAEYREPSEEELLREIWSHHYLRKHTLASTPLRD